jgi:Bacteriophage Mu, GemA protein
MKRRHEDGPTRKQEQLIHILERQLVRKELLDDRGYRHLLTKWFGRNSSRELTPEEASLLIDRLVQMGGVISRRPGHDSRRRRILASRFHEESSMEGLRNEVLQIARERYGEDFGKPLAALCRKLNIPDYSSMDVRHGKALKKTLLRLEAGGPYIPGKK